MRRNYGTTFVCLAIFLVAGVSIGLSAGSSDLQIVSPFCYTVYELGEVITLVAGGVPDPSQTMWVVEGVDFFLYGEPSCEFVFVPEIPGNYSIYASLDDMTASIEVTVLLPTEETALEPWMQASFVESLDDLEDVLFADNPFILHESDAAPITVSAEWLSFETSQPLETTLMVSVYAEIVDESGILEAAYEYWTELSSWDETATSLSVPLYPEAINHIQFQGYGESLGLSAPISYSILNIAQAIAPPALFQQAGPPPAAPVICEIQLQTALNRFISNAKNVSRELAQHLNDVVLHNGAENVTDATTGQIRISRTQLRNALRTIAGETDPNKRAKLEEQLKRQMVGILLHEAGHRKSVKAGTTAGATRAQEEVRNITELIKRLVAALGRLNQRIRRETPTLAPDSQGIDGQSASTWFDRCHTMIKQQMTYLLKWLKQTDPAFRQAYDNMRRNLGQLKRDLAAIRNDNTKTQAQKTAAARQRMTQFQTQARNDLQTITQKSGLVIEFSLNEPGLTVKITTKVGTSFAGQTIPTKATP